MQDFIRFSAFVLLVVGTFGLLGNEFVFHWGRPATITLATLNVVGLATLAFTTWSTKKKT